MFSLVGAFFIFPTLVAGQFYGPPPGPQPGTTTEAAVNSAPTAPPSTENQINIDVAPSSFLEYNPANVSASPGSTVTFYFPGVSIAHSVTQSSFENPCTYLAASSNNPAGFDSGLVLASTFTVNITDNKPIYFHCKQILHCGSGMVGTINAPSTGNTFDAFMSAAKNLGVNAPTDDPNAVVTGGVHGVATATPSSDTGGSSGGVTSRATTLMASSFAAILVEIVIIFT